jgi:hypothetical protein
MLTSTLPSSATLHDANGADGASTATQVGCAPAFASTVTLLQGAASTHTSIVSGSPLAKASAGLPSLNVTPFTQPMSVQLSSSLQPLTTDAQDTTTIPIP